MAKKKGKKQRIAADERYRPPKRKNTLAEVLAVSDPDPWQNRIGFMQALVEWAAGTPAATKETMQENWPEPARMFATLNGLQGELYSSGIGAVADHSLGDEFDDMMRWLEQIGAATTRAYLAEFAQLFPNGAVVKDRDERWEWLEEKHGEEKLDQTYRALDKKYREPSIDEIPDRLREYVEKNAAAIEAQLNAR